MEDLNVKLIIEEDGILIVLPEYLDEKDVAEILSKFDVNVKVIQE